MNSCQKDKRPIRNTSTEVLRKSVKNGQNYRKTTRGFYKTIKLPSHIATTVSESKAK
uniref:Uncharacterized protein n=1 Tax=Lepeophtheirus salmonis TaxID=72036 RepID=A0A0K2V979_LEPSM